ncbi:MAG: XdhC family protein [Xanthomonadales bacterium]|nr:XdhC family protein [Xanthomonadales bacterium]
MHLGLTALLAFYDAHRGDDALVLGTVVATQGSTYRKPGAMMLIAADSSYRGLISGGCLESDLAAHARDVFADGKTRNVCYDMSDGDDFTWGLGLGCDGIIHLMLQRLDGNTGFGFLETLDKAWKNRNSGLLSLVTSSSDPAYSAGDYALDCGSGLSTGETLLTQGKRTNEGASFSSGHDMSRRYWQDSINTASGSIELLLIPIMPPPAILICGAGHDAVPVARLAAEMGWNCTIVDHRPGFARADRFPASCDVRVLQPSELSQQIALEEVDAAVLMTHHLGHDRTYLSQVTEASLSYIGLLGPRARRDRLLDETGATGVHVHGPAGLDIGAEMPESIALAIIAEIHAFLNRRDGSMLTQTGV